MTAASTLLESPEALPDIAFCNSRAIHSCSSPRTLKVLHIVNGEHYAGAERVQDLLAMRLPDFGVDVELACVKPVAFPAARMCQQTPLLNMPMSFRFDPLPAWKLSHYVRGGGFNLIHTHTPRSLLVGQWAARLAGVPLVHHIHGQTAIEVGRGWRAWLAAKIEHRSLNRAAAAIAVSLSAAEYIESWGIQRERVHVIPNGVPASKHFVQRKTPTGKWMLGTVALFRPRKGLTVLLQALAILQSRALPVCLRVIGGFETPKYEQEVRSLVQKLKIDSLIEWRGFRSDIDAELTDLDIMILPSLLAEGMPMVVLEAMAAGVPTIGSDVPGIADVISDGSDGLLVPPDDSVALADCLAKVITGSVDWQTLHRNARETFAAKYSDRQMAATVADVYRQVLSNPEGLLR